MRSPQFPVRSRSTSVRPGPIRRVFSQPSRRSSTPTTRSSTRLNTQLTTKPDSSDPTVGTLFGDSELTNLLGNMRQSIYTPMLRADGYHEPCGHRRQHRCRVGQRDVLQRRCRREADDRLDRPRERDPEQPQRCQADAPEACRAAFSTIVNNESRPGGTLDSRIQGDTAQISDITDQITNLECDRSPTARRRFRPSSPHSRRRSRRTSPRASWLTSQINSLPGWAS